MLIFNSQNVQRESTVGQWTDRKRGLPHIHEFHWASFVAKPWTFLQVPIKGAPGVCRHQTQAGEDVEKDQISTGQSQASHS